MSRWTDLFEPGAVVLDGGLSTQLQVRGADIAGPLWTGRALLADPGIVEHAHQDFIHAGADVIITASYQISRRGFEQQGIGRGHADTALTMATRVARSAARATHARVAASVGPYGAVLHDGSEYRGNYGLSRDELASFHAERLEVLVSSEPDLLAIETIPDVHEAEAIGDALATVDALPAWMSFSCKDEAHVCAGHRIEDAVAVAASIPSVMAVGINCTDPAHVAGLLERIAATTDLPVVVYANAGGTWDAATGEWVGAFGHVSDHVEQWARAGAVAIGGCCGTDARDIRLVAERLR